jgi:CRP-like cAMP-binding protein
LVICLLQPRTPNPRHSPEESAAASSTNFPNHFLATLSPDDSDLLRPHLKHQDLTLRSILFRPGETIDRVYFPSAGIISVVVGLSDGHMVEAGMFGRNSVVGGGAALDGRVAINQAIIQASGSSLTIEIGVLAKFVGASDSLRAALMRHELASYAMTQQVAACNARHELEERLCRWLMQTRDLLASDTLPLTQEFLAQMLGVQRSSLTLIARRLQESGLIKYRRGHIQVLDAVHLQEGSCECYGVINQHFERLIGWRPSEADFR